MTLDFTKPITTRDGRAVRILCQDRKGDEPIVGLVLSKNGNEFPFTWTLDGKYVDQLGKSINDIINPPVKRRGWVAIFALVDAKKLLEGRALTPFP